MASIPNTDLNPEKREIRLLEVVAEPKNTHISYRLHTVSLDDNLTSLPCPMSGVTAS